MKIAIDAGHGPNTAGKRCPDDSMREFSFNAAVARYLRDGLAEYGGVSVLFSHADDGSRDVPLAERVRAANEWAADIFVSIHANAAGNGWNDANGIETFAAVNASAASVKLADAIQRRLITETGRRDRGVKRSDFYVIKNTAMPAVLVEAGFMTNRAEAELLKSDNYRKKVAAAIAAAIADVYGLKRKEQKGAESVSSTRTEANIKVNGRALAEKGYVEKGVTHVPVRAVAEALGARVTWDGVTNTVDITK